MGFVQVGRTEVQSTYCKSLQYGKLEKWKLYDDTIPSLTELRNNNWKSVLVTNNIPEFPTIMKHLNFEEYFDAVFVSSLIGFNKPNPSILDGYLETLQDKNKIINYSDADNVLQALGSVERSWSFAFSQPLHNAKRITHHLLTTHHSPLITVYFEEISQHAHHAYLFFFLLFNNKYLAVS